MTRRNTVARDSSQVRNVKKGSCGYVDARLSLIVKTGAHNHNNLDKEATTWAAFCFAHTQSSHLSHHHRLPTPCYTMAGGSG